MENITKILVLENDEYTIPDYLKYYLESNDLPKEYWFNFSNSFHYNAEDNHKRLSQIDEKTLIVSAPSFVGSENSFHHYVLLFIKYEKLNFLVLYPDGFYTYILQYLSDPFMNNLKKQRVHEMIKELLTKHNLYEIVDNKYVKITYELLMENYFETNRANREIVRVKETGETYPIYSIYYHENLEESDVELIVPNGIKENYKLSEIEKIK